MIYFSMQFLRVLNLKNSRIGVSPLFTRIHFLGNLDKSLLYHTTFLFSAYNVTERSTYGNLVVLSVMVSQPALGSDLFVVPYLYANIRHG